MRYLLFMLVALTPCFTLAQNTILRTPNERFEDLADYNFTANYIEVEEGLRMHYVDEGEKDKPIVLLLHGEPSWSYLYRHIIPPLKKNGFRVIAPDLIGFGKSDKLTNKDLYTYEQSVKWMKTFIEKLELNNVLLFCQDWGGLIGLRVVSELPNKFSMIIASNTALPTGEPKFPEAFYNWLEYSKSNPDINAGYILNSASLTNLTEEEIAAYNAPFPSEEYKVAAQIYPSLVPLTVEDPQAKMNQKAWEVFKKWQKPFLTVFGDSDPLTGWAQEVFKSQIPGAKGQDHQVLKASHFIQEDKSEELVDLILKFYKEHTINKN